MYNTLYMYTCCILNVIWFSHSLGEPHIDHDNSSHTQNNGIYISIYLSIYLSIYHLPCICHTLVPKICVHPEMLHVFRYIDVLMCLIYNCTRLNSKDDCSFTRFSHADYQRRQVGECANT